MSTKLIKVKENEHITITKTFTPSNVQKNMNSKFKNTTLNIFLLILFVL
jgi:hypothetical protein